MSSAEPNAGDAGRRRYSFAGFTLDAEGGFLRRGDTEIALPPKPFEVLVYLVEHHDRLVTKSELIEAVWPHTAVTDNSLAQCLMEIRKALADHNQPLIRTVPRRGYLLAIPVTVAAGAGGGVSRRRLNPLIWGCGCVLLAIAAEVAFRPERSAKPDLSYTQITSFTDSVVAPVLSPDGRMLAFFRSDNWFHTTDQIYVKFLPDGEPVQITHDSRPKYSLAFSTDGSRIAYTVESPDAPPQSVTISPFGGEPTLLLSNAAGVTWLDGRRLLFSETATGIHMGIVTATESRSEYRRIYFPQHERGMAHFSFPSPDRKWALVLEMDPIWHPCRIVPLDGSSTGRQAGPVGRCTSAAWSPDGRWMYFGVEAGGEHHLWRERFPRGEPEQITSGPTEEDGVAVAPDGRSLITSIGVHESAVWIHDVQGERAISTEGYVAPMKVAPVSSVRFAANGKSIFYLMRRDSPTSAVELWRTDLQSELSERVLPGASMVEYDLSSDGTEVVFSTEKDGVPQIWLARLDRTSPPRLIAASGGGMPHFGRDGQLFFRLREGKANYLARMKRVGTEPARVIENPITAIQAVSPDRNWIVVSLTMPDGVASVAVPATGGTPRRICEGYCPAAWSPDGTFFYVALAPPSRTNPGRTVVIPAPAGRPLPALPASGIRGLEDASALPGARVIAGYDISPGRDPSTYAYTRTTVHRNLFRIALRDE